MSGKGRGGIKTGCSAVCNSSSTFDAPVTEEVEKHAVSAGTESEIALVDVVLMCSIINLSSYII